MPYDLNVYVFADEDDHILSVKQYSSDKLAKDFSLHLANRYNKTVHVYKTIFVSHSENASATERGAGSFRSSFE